MRLGFWLNRALTDVAVKAWLKGTIVDCAIYTPNQVIYAAAPVFKNGRINPVPRRSGVLEGGENTVTPGEPPPPVARSPKATTPRINVERRKAPEGIVFDTKAAIERGRELIERALASDEWENPSRDLPSPTGARAYKLAARLKDEALSPEKIVDLFIEMVPWFDERERRELGAMADSVFRHGQNESGCGNPNSIAHLFTEIIEQWKVETRGGQTFWEKIVERSQGVIQPLPNDSAPTEFSLAFTVSVRRIIAEDRAEMARRLG